MLAIADPRLLQPMLYCVLGLGVIGCIYLASSNEQDKLNRYR